jgi:hypothetical protein
MHGCNFLFFWQELFGLCRAERRSAHTGASAARPYTPLACATRGPTRPLGMFGCGQWPRCATHPTTTLHSRTRRGEGIHDADIRPLPRGG